MNFTAKENYKLIYETEYPSKLKGIKLDNLSSFDLEYIDKSWHKECIVNKTHFNKNGYYYTLHSNHKGSKTISYEAPLVNVIVKEEPTPEPKGDNDGTNYGLIIGLFVAAFIIICLVVIIALYYLKNKDKKTDKLYDKTTRGEDDGKDNENKDEKKEILNDMITSNDVNEEIRQSEANKDRINA